MDTFGYEPQQPKHLLPQLVPLESLQTNVICLLIAQHTMEHTQALVVQLHLQLVVDVVLRKKEREKQQQQPALKQCNKLKRCNKKERVKTTTTKGLKTMQQTTNNKTISP
jgi:hypothetical protein